VPAQPSRSAFTPSAGSVPNFVAQKPDSVKIRSNSPQIEKVFREYTRLTNPKIQGARADYWRGGCKKCFRRLEFPIGAHNNNDNNNNKASPSNAPEKKGRMQLPACVRPSGKMHMSKVSKQDLFIVSV
jgi:hypothetical protein